MWIAIRDDVQQVLKVFDGLASGLCGAANRLNQRLNERADLLGNVGLAEIFLVPNENGCLLPDSSARPALTCPSPSKAMRALLVFAAPALHRPPVEPELVGNLSVRVTRSSILAASQIKREPQLRQLRFRLQ